MCIHFVDCVCYELEGFLSHIHSISNLLNNCCFKEIIKLRVNVHNSTVITCYHNICFCGVEEWNPIAVQISPKRSLHIGNPII